MRINPHPFPFIAIEGIDGSGKTTLMKALQNWDRANKIGAIFTKEPTDGSYGERIRAILKNNGCDETGRILAPDAMQRLYMEDRLEHRIAEAGFLQMYPIFSDRDFLSTFSYALAQGVSFNWVLKEHEKILGNNFFIPDLTIVLDLDPGRAMERSRRSEKMPDFFEKELKFRENIDKGYWQAQRLLKEAFSCVNIEFVEASFALNEVLSQSVPLIQNIFRAKSAQRRQSDKSKFVK